MSHFKGTDRFVIQRLLGSGGFGMVYEALDRERQLKVALKVPFDPTAQNLFAFKQEFRALADVAHPNLVDLFELMVHGQEWFFTMELLDGPTFYDFLCPGDTRERRGAGSAASEGDGSRSGQRSLRSVYGRSSHGDSSGAGSKAFLEETSPGLAPARCYPPEDYDAVRAATRQLAEGVAALHQLGKLHRNLKPSNVRVAPGGRVVLLDLGLSPDPGAPAADAFGPPRLAGTPAFMAPEQIGGHATSEASDWYSLGAMLYQALTGQVPFPGGSLASVINKMRTDPPAPRLLVPGTPADLDELCMALLKRKPEFRPSGPAILERLGGTLPGLRPRPAAAPRPVVSNRLIGREPELAILAKAFAQSQEGHAVLVLVHGRSGMGKSYLLRRYLRDLQREEPRAVLLEGRCYEQESAPYKALGTVVESLAQHLGGLPEAKVAALLPRNLPSLARLFPVLLQVGAVASFQGGAAPAPDPQELRRRAFGALRELLGRIADRFPLVLTIDNLQWIDPDSVALLSGLFGTQAPPSMLVLASFCTGESRATLSLEELQETLAEGGAELVAIPVQDLSREEARKLAMALLEPDDPEAPAKAARIAEEANGNPFFIGELVRLARGGAAAPGHGADNLEGYLRSRVAQLAEGPRRLLDALALAGRPLAWELLAAACGLPKDDLEPLALLRSGHFIRTRGATALTVEIYHDRTREAVLPGIPPARTRAIHLALARALEGSPEGDVQALALHFQAAGEIDKAADYALLAARAAMASLAFERAARFLRKVLELKAPTGQEYVELLVELGDALAHAGLGAEAAQTYLKAVPGSVPAEAQRLQRRASEEYFRSGRFDLGVATLKGVMTSVGLGLSASPIRALAASLWYRARLRLRGLGFTARKEAEIPREVLDRIDLCWAAAMGLGPIDHFRGVAFQARQLLLTLEAGEPFRIVRALAQETIYASHLGNRGLAATGRLQALTLAVADQTGHPNPMSRAFIAAGTAALMEGRWRPAVEHLEQAELLLKEHCTGLDFELHIAQFHGLLAHLVLGDLREVEARYSTRLQAAKEKGNLLAVTNLRTAIAPSLLLAQDDPGKANRETRQAIEDWSTAGFHVQHYNALCSLVNIQLYGGNPEGAWDLLQGARKALRRSLLLRAQAILITILELRARTALALASAAPLDSRTRNSRLRTAHEAIQVIEAEGTPYGEALALKLQAMEAMVRDRPEEAAALFFQAEVAFQACDMALHGAVVRHCRGRLEGPSGQDHVEAAQWWLRNQGVANPLRYVAMHVPNMGPAQGLASGPAQGPVLD